MAQSRPRLHPNSRPPRSPLDEVILRLKEATLTLRLTLTRVTPQQGTQLHALLITLALINLATSLAPNVMVCSGANLSRGFLWTLPLAPFVLPPVSGLMGLLLLGLYAYQASGAMSAGRVLDQRPLWVAGVAWGTLSLLSLLLGGVVWSFVLTSAMLIWFAEPLSRTPLKRLSPLTLTLAVGVGVGVIVGLLKIIGSGGALTGDHALVRGAMVAWGVRQGTRELPLIKVKGRDLKWVLLVFSVLESIFNPSPTHLSGLASVIAVSLWLQASPQRAR